MFEVSYCNCNACESQNKVTDNLESRIENLEKQQGLSTSEKFFWNMKETFEICNVKLRKISQLITGVKNILCPGNYVLPKL